MGTKFKSDIVLGEKYLDEQTGMEGTATAVYFFQYACERVQIETFDVERKTVRNEVFDAPRLTRVKTGRVARTARTGGPGDGIEPGVRAGSQPVVQAR